MRKGGTKVSDYSPNLLLMTEYQFHKAVLRTIVSTLALALGVTLLMGGEWEQIIVLALLVILPLPIFGAFLKLHLRRVDNKEGSRYLMADNDIVEFQLSTGCVKNFSKSSNVQVISCDGEDVKKVIDALAGATSMEDLIAKLEESRKEKKDGNDQG